MNFEINSIPQQKESSFRKTSEGVWNRIVSEAAEKMLHDIDTIDCTPENITQLTEAINTVMEKDSVLASAINRLSNQWAKELGDVAATPDSAEGEEKKAILLMNELKQRINISELFSQSKSETHTLH